MTNLDNVAECLVISFLSDLADPYSDRFAGEREAYQAVRSCRKIGSAEGCLETTIRGERVLVISTIRIYQGVIEDDPLRPHHDDAEASRSGGQ